jgi:hypothetical protein
VQKLVNQQVLPAIVVLHSALFLRHVENKKMVHTHPFESTTVKAADPEPKQYINLKKENVIDIKKNDIVLLFI